MFSVVEQDEFEMLRCKCYIKNLNLLIYMVHEGLYLVYFDHKKTTSLKELREVPMHNNEI